MMHKKLPLILVWLIVTGLLVYYFINFYQLLSKSYYVDESKLYKVDTFHLLNRAYERLDDRGGGRFSHSNQELVFQSTGRHSFAIDENIFKAIIDKKRLEDTLMYHDLKFTVFTSKEYFDKYRKTNNPVFIRVYQIQIGNTKYVDISKMNKLSKADTLRRVIIPPGFIFFLAFLIFKDPGWWTNRKIVIWSICFVATIIGLLILT